jgi:hypothetical protein
LQKAYVDLEIAKTISLAAKTNMKRRTIMLRRSRRRDNLEEIDIVSEFLTSYCTNRTKEGGCGWHTNAPPCLQLGLKIREAVSMWHEYTYSAPLLVDGKDILDILDREDDLISKNVSTLALFDWLFPLYTTRDSGY